MSGEAVTLGVDGHESEVDALVAVHHNGVHNVVLVERDGDGRVERTDEAVEEQLHIVVVEVHVLEDGVHVLAEGLRVNNVLQSEDAFFLQDTLFAVRFPLEILV